jgi:hypothetical protein
MIPSGRRIPERPPAVFQSRRLPGLGARHLAYRREGTLASFPARADVAAGTATGEYRSGTDGVTSVNCPFMGLGSHGNTRVLRRPRLAGAETIWFTRADRGRFYSIVKDPARRTADLRRTTAAESVRLWDGDARRCLAGTGKDACPTLSIAGGKKHLGCFCFVFMEIRAVIGFRLKRLAAVVAHAGGVHTVETLDCGADTEALSGAAWQPSHSRTS